MAQHSFIPYPPIERHGLIGDRRTAALVAADGTIDWLCLPNYDQPSIFGALLDAHQGGFWRMGPSQLLHGQQRYYDDSAILTTTWTTESGELELSDFMAWPENERPVGQEQRRVVVRRLRCLHGTVTAVMELCPRRDFDHAAAVTATNDGATFDLGEYTLGLWTSFPLVIDPTRAYAQLNLQQGESAWAILDFDHAAAGWSNAAAEHVFDTTVGYWHGWLNSLTYTGPRRKNVLRSVLVVHLLGYAPTGALVAAPTTSLPERIGGDRNWDYRFAWVRDASLSMALISLLGDTETAHRYMDCLASLASETDSPLQVMYGIDGHTQLPARQRTDLAGYRGSLPVQQGNRAYNQRQLDSLGFLGECALVYIEHGGVWKDAYWELIRRAADYTAANWQERDSGIWELPEHAHYVSSKVMSWVMLKRAVQVAEWVGRVSETDHWRETMDVIHAEVMERGWSEELQSFRQHYDTDQLDASVLLIAVMGFLPADHPRVLATVERVVAELTIDGFVYRFIPSAGELPLGAFEGAFLPCTFWLATTYAKQGRVDEADAILRRVEEIAGELALFAEEVDARQRTFLGNYPLVFSHVEYIQAVVELAKAKPIDTARYMIGAAKIQAQRIAGKISGNNQHKPNS